MSQFDSHHALAAFQALYMTHMGQVGMAFGAASALAFGVFVRRGSKRSEAADTGLLILTIALMMVGVFLMFKATLVFMPENICTVVMFYFFCLLLCIALCRGFKPTAH